MYTTDVIKAVINTQHGWAVADQFEDTFTGEAFEKQNYNALMYIRDTVRDILNSDVLSNDSYRALTEYYDELEDYIVGGGDEEEEVEEVDDREEDE